jgi:subtilase family serine protease
LLPARLPSDLSETDLDLEWSGGVATGASIVLVNSGDVFTSLQYAIQNSINGITIPIISVSYGNCEANWSTGNLERSRAGCSRQTVRDRRWYCRLPETPAQPTAMMSGVTSATLGLAVDYPGSSAYVTDVGGSEFMGDGTAPTPQTGAGTYWSANGSSRTI